MIYATSSAPQQTPIYPDNSKGSRHVKGLPYSGPEVVLQNGQQKIIV